MTTTLKASLTYFVIVFAAGFVLGALRVVALAPHIGPTLAVGVELPVMLVISWIVCAWTVSRLHVPGRIRERLIMGGLAFLLLLVAEFALGTVAFGRTVPEQIAALRAPDGTLGLLGQIAFAFFPFMQLRSKER